MPPHIWCVFQFYSVGTEAQQHFTLIHTVTIVELQLIRSWLQKRGGTCEWRCDLILSTWPWNSEDHYTAHFYPNLGYFDFSLILNKLNNINPWNRWNLSAPLAQKKTMCSGNGVKSERSVLEVPPHRHTIHRIKTYHTNHPRPVSQVWTERSGTGSSKCTL